MIENILAVSGNSGVQKNYFSCFAFALRLVVLPQLPSCSVERAFSRLKVIRGICGGWILEDSLEMRLFIQCNGDVHEIMTDIEKNMGKY